MFSLEGEPLGCVSPETGFSHRINTGDATPITKKPYNLSRRERLQLKVDIQRLLRLGVIRPTTSPWLSHVVCVRKPNGKIRLCLDLRLLNSKTLPDAYPLPRIEDVHAAMSGCSLWSQMDLVGGF